MEVWTVLRGILVAGACWTFLKWETENWRDGSFSISRLASKKPLT